MHKKIIIGSDHGGFNLKQKIIEHLKSNGYEIDNVGCFSEESCDYPVIAKQVCEKVISENTLGILVCGTGLGMSIYANKVKGIRASHCTDTFSARLTRQHNDSNILCLGERITGSGLALDIVDEWLNASFEGGRHQRRVDMINELDMEKN